MSGSRTGETRTQTSPLSVVISAFAPVADVRKEPDAATAGTDAGDTRLILIDLGNGKNRLGGSALAQVFGEVGDVAPDLDQPQQLKAAFDAVQSLNAAGRVLAYHDRSDGGLYAAFCEGAGLCRTRRPWRFTGCTWRRSGCRTVH